MSKNAAESLELQEVFLGDKATVEVTDTKSKNVEIEEEVEGCCWIQQSLKAKLKKIGVTLEPSAFLISFGMWLIYGARVDTNLQMWKICLDELNYTGTHCDDLTNETNIEVMAEVQVWLNNFDMVNAWITGVPGLVYAIFVGSLADDFGRKPLMILPTMGGILTSLVKIINLVWVRELPTGFFYLSNGLFYNLLGGYSVYYLGSYSFGASVSSESQRASTLARIDGLRVCLTLLRHCVKGAFSKVLSVRYFDIATLTS